MSNRVRNLFIRAAEKAGLRCYSVNSAEGYLAVRAEPDEKAKPPRKPTRPKNGKR